MYKDWTEEVAASGMSSIDYIRKMKGIDKYYKKSKWMTIEHILKKQNMLEDNYNCNNFMWV